VNNSWEEVMARAALVISFLLSVLAACVPTKHNNSRSHDMSEQKNAAHLQPSETEQALINKLKDFELEILSEKKGICKGPDDQDVTFLGSNTPIQLILRYSGLELPPVKSSDLFAHIDELPPIPFKRLITDTALEKEYITSEIEFSSIKPGQRIGPIGISIYYQDNKLGSQHGLVIDATMPPKPVKLRVVDEKPDSFVLAWDLGKKAGFGDIKEFIVRKWNEETDEWPPIARGFDSPKIQMKVKPEGHFRVTTVNCALNHMDSDPKVLIPEGLRPLVDNLSRQLVNNRKVKRSISLAVFGFNVDGRRHGLVQFVEEGLMVSKQLNNAFGIQHGFKENYYEKWQKDRPGMLSDAWAIQYGKELGVRAVLTGSMTTIGEKLNVRAWIMDLKNDPHIIQISQAETELPLSEVPEDFRPERPVAAPGAISFSQLSFSYRSNPLLPGPNRAGEIQNHTVVQTSDRYKILFTPDQDCYVYIFQADSAGRLVKLWPMEKRQDEAGQNIMLNNFNPVQAGKTYYAPGAGLSFELDDAIGRERFYFFAFKAPNNELENIDMETQLSGLSKKGLLDRYFTTKGPAAGIVRDEIHPVPVPWKEGNILEVANQKLFGMADKCLLMIEFIHQ